MQDNEQRLNKVIFDVVVLEVVRESAWDNIVTCHQGKKEARTWSFQRKCIGKHNLKSRAGENAGPVTVCNFVFYFVGEVEVLSFVTPCSHLRIRMLWITMFLYTCSKHSRPKLTSRDKAKD